MAANSEQILPPPPNVAGHRRDPARRLRPERAVFPAVWSDVRVSQHRLVQATESVPAPNLLAAPGNSDTVDLHLNEVDVRQAFELLSRSHGINVLVAPGVQGQVTANFEQAGIDEAIQAILKLCDLVGVREGDLLYVYAPEEFPQADMQVRVFPLDFVAGQDVQTGVQGLLSSAGSATITEIDTADNRRAREAIMVTDIPASLARIEQYVAQMDQPPRQVVIEAHVLEVELGEGCRHGINYEQIMKLAGSEVKLDLVGFAEPLASPAVFASIKGGDVNALLHILKTTTDAKTLASPRVMVVNGQKARLQVGGQLGFRVTTVTETAAVEDVKFLEVGVVLEVTPRISRDNRVLLQVRPKVSTGEINPDTELPEEETSEIETDVLLQDGQGVVIGGLIQEKDIDVEKKLPVLGNLYLIGWIFRKWEVSKRRTETLITLVPRICPCEPNVYSERDAVDAERARTPLFYGPLERYPRPWEPILPGTARNPERLGEHLDFGRGNSCGTPSCRSVDSFPMGVPGREYYPSDEAGVPDHEPLTPVPETYPPEAALPPEPVTGYE
jgi:type II secretory pathway component GspD/PulD (secretin)